MAEVREDVVLTTVRTSRINSGDRRPKTLVDSLLQDPRAWCTLWFMITILAMVIMLHKVWIKPFNEEEFFPKFIDTRLHMHNQVLRAAQGKLEGQSNFDTADVQPTITNKSWSIHFLYQDSSDGHDLLTYDHLLSISNFEEMVEKGLELTKLCEKLTLIGGECMPFERLSTPFIDISEQEFDEINKEIVESDEYQLFRRTHLQVGFSEKTRGEYGRSILEFRLPENYQDHRYDAIFVQYLSTLQEIDELRDAVGKATTLNVYFYSMAKWENNIDEEVYPKARILLNLSVAISTIFMSVRVGTCRVWSVGAATIAVPMITQALTSMITRSPFQIGVLDPLLNLLLFGVLSETALRVISILQQSEYANRHVTTLTKEPILNCIRGTLPSNMLFNLISILSASINIDPIANAGAYCCLFSLVSYAAIITLLIPEMMMHRSYFLGKWNVKVETQSDQELEMQGVPKASPQPEDEDEAMIGETTKSQRPPKKGTDCWRGIHRVSIPLLLGWVCLALFLTFQVRDSPMINNWHAPDDPSFLERNILLRNFAPEESVRVGLVYGLHESKAARTSMFAQLADRLIWDEKLDFSRQETQKGFVGLCEELRASDLAARDVNCLIEDFSVWLSFSQKEFPVAESEFNQEFTKFLDESESGEEAVKAGRVGMRAGKVAFLVIEVEAEYKHRAENESAIFSKSSSELYSEFSSFIEEYERNQVEGALSGGFVTSEQLARSVRDSDWRGACLFRAVVVTAAAIFVFYHETNSQYLALCGTIQILFITSTIGATFTLLNIPLGFDLVFGLPFAIGICTLFLSGLLREYQIQRAAVGPEMMTSGHQVALFASASVRRILFSPLTVIVVALYLAGPSLLVYQRFSQVLLAAIGLSCLSSVILLPGLISLKGDVE